MPAVTISIVSYNGIGKIEACLRSLHDQTFTDFDLIVVDNASSDGTIAAVTRLFPQARLIALDHNVGFGVGHNKAIRESTAPYVLVLNQDVVLQPPALARLMQAATSSGAAAVGPLLLRPNSNSVREAIIDTASLTRTWWWQVSDRGSSRPLEHRYERSGFVWGISGACLLLKREALAATAYHDKNGQPEYFDETFFMYKEDVDLAARLHRHGYRSWYEAEAIGEHGRTGFAPVSTAQQPQHRRKLPAYVREYSYRNHWFVIIKHAWLVQWPLIWAYEVVKALFLLLREPHTLSVLPQVIKALPSLLRRRYER